MKSLVLEFDDKKDSFQALARAVQEFHKLYQPYNQSDEAFLRDFRVAMRSFTKMVAFWEDTQRW